jgi:hypothetical protein
MENDEQLLLFRVAQHLKPFLLMLMDDWTKGAPAVRTKALLAAGWLAYYQFDFARATVLFADVARDRGDPARVRALCDACLAVFRELGEQWAIGFALNNLALAAYQDGDLAQAADLAQQSVDLFRVLQTGTNIAEALATLGLVSCAQGATARAKAALSEALRLVEAGAPCWLTVAALESPRCCQCPADSVLLCFDQLQEQTVHTGIIAQLRMEG